MTEAAVTPAAEPETPVEAAAAFDICANCGTALQGAYCHDCGQKAKLQSKLRHIAAEFIESAANFDGRLWRTLPLVFFKPGTLSRRWREGQRVRYVAPLHFFLFALFLVFLVPELTGRDLIRLPSAAELEADGGRGTGPSISIGPGAREQVRAQSRARLQEAQAEVEREAAAQGVDPATVQGAEAFAARAERRLQKVFANNEYYSERIQNLTSRLSFALVPITMAILWLLLLFKRGYSMYDHAVVALYGVGVLALLVAVSLALPGPAAGWAVTALLFLAPVHAVAHLKGAYALSWPGAVIRGVFLGVLSIIAYSLFLLGVLLAGIFL